MLLYYPVSTLVGLLLIIVLVAMIGYGVGLILTRVYLHRAPETSLTVWPALSLLKPIKGLEEDLAENLRSFFEQDYPGPLEIVFSSANPRDPGMAVARNLAADYPHIATHFVISNPAYGLNPKVANLAAAMDSARYDLVFQSDANVRASAGYLKNIVHEFQTHGASLLSSPVVGDGEESTGAALENLHLSSYLAPAACVTQVAANVTCVIGKSMLLRRSELASLGGLDHFKNILCEDFMLGRRYVAAGHTVMLSRFPIININICSPAAHFVRRHSRWMKMTAAIHMPAFILSLVWGNPIAVATLAAVLSGFSPPALAILLATGVLKTLGDAWLVTVTRRRPMAWNYALLLPIKDLMVAVMWPYAAISRSVRWRGKHLRMGRGSQLYPDARPFHIRLAQRVLAR